MYGTPCRSLYYHNSTALSCVTCHPQVIAAFANATARTGVVPADFRKEPICANTNAIRLIAPYERGPLKQIALDSEDKRMPDGRFFRNVGVCFFWAAVLQIG